MSNIWCCAEEVAGYLVRDGKFELNISLLFGFRQSSLPPMKYAGMRNDIKNVRTITVTYGAQTQQAALPLALVISQGPLSDVILQKT